jgi:transcriptional regulator with XRE-family HTH domain
MNLNNIYDLSPDSEVFHQELRRARADRGLTQSELAQELGISSVMTQRYEMDLSKKNSARPNPITAKKIHDFFLIPPTQAVLKAPENLPLSNISLDDLLKEIGARGYKVSLESKN